MKKIQKAAFAACVLIAACSSIAVKAQNPPQKFPAVGSTHFDIKSILGKRRDTVEKLLGPPLRKVNQTPKQKTQNIYRHAIYSLPGYKEAFIRWSGEPDNLLYDIDLTPLEEPQTWQGALKPLGLKTAGVSVQEQTGLLLHLSGLPEGFKAYWNNHKLSITNKE